MIALLISMMKVIHFRKYHHCFFPTDYLIANQMQKQQYASYIQSRHGVSVFVGANVVWVFEAI